MNTEFFSGENTGKTKEKKRNTNTFTNFIWYFYGCFDRYHPKCARANALQTFTKNFWIGTFALIFRNALRYTSTSTMMATATTTTYKRRNFHIGITEIRIRTNKSTIKWMVLFFVFINIWWNSALASSICLWRTSVFITRRTKLVRIQWLDDQFRLVTKLRFKPIKSNESIYYFWPNGFWCWFFISMRGGSHGYTYENHIKFRIKFTFSIQKRIIIK